MNNASIELLYSWFLVHGRVTTDTRNIKPGDIFFALRGPNFDGNSFALKALEAGAFKVVADDPALASHPNILVCPNALSMLQQLAGYHRNKLNIPVLAITGSNGKTTTKELVHAVLSSTFRTATTEGNLNNHIGVPLTLLRIPANAEIAVIEMGANHQQEIAGYCTYTRPTHGIITNCGKAHLEGFGGVEGVKKGKGELFDFLKLHQGKAFACADFDYFTEMIKNRHLQNIDWYGTQPGATLQAIPQLQGDFLEVQVVAGFEPTFAINTQLVGAYNIYNVLAALAIGRYFGVSAGKMKEAIENYHPDNSRSQLVIKGSNAIVLDAYNANPTSMAEAIRNFAAIGAQKKILMIGAMAELGAESAAEHEGIIKLIETYNWETVVLVGKHFEPYRHKFLYFTTADEAALWWQQQTVENAHILLKGSRSTAMEKILKTDSGK
ncbi:MAG: UDP-N-acetylmuramoyl-tripeptide--D-alanyl-D-alanine ligase [Chitinophagaceae bacterium]|nr:UDP-N-acetylmuramoyl-tripeptide--D-alanyl-D-alanine ligase [Chitinophagaceae bacterium]